MCTTVENSVETLHNSRISTERSRKNGLSHEKTSTGKALPVDKKSDLNRGEGKKNPQNLKTLWTDWRREVEKGKEKTRDLSISGYGVDNGTRTHDLQSHNLTP